MIRARLVALLAAVTTLAGTLAACASAPPPSKAASTSPVPSPRSSAQHAPSDVARKDVGQEVPVKGPPLRVEMWGDSIGVQAAPYFNFLLGSSKKGVGRTHVFPGTALCDWLTDIRDELDRTKPTAF